MITTRRGRRLRPLSLLAAASAALLLAACAGPATTAAPDGERQLVIARAMDLTTLDPHVGYCDTCQIIFDAMYQTLVVADPDNPGEVLPQLAESWEVNDDATQFTFHLDPDAVFSDGSPVEASDVKFSWDRFINLQGNGSFLGAGITAIDTPDSATVVFSFAEPNSVFLSIAAARFPGIVNADVVREAGGTDAADAATTDSAEEWFLKNSAGSGPYQLASYTEGSSIELTANPDYWGDAVGFSDVLIKEVSDSSSQLQQLQQGDVDIAMQISPDALDQLSGVSNVTTSLEDSYNFVYLVLQAGATGGEALDDVRVRKAIRAGIDYDKVIDATVAGKGKTQGSPIPNGFAGSESVDQPVHDPDEARKLLAEAGYADGITLTAAYPKFTVYGVDFDVMMQSIQQDLAEVGVTLQLESLDYTQWAQRVRDDDGIPVSAVYFAPDYMDSSGYVSYFGMIPDSRWSSRAGANGPLVNQVEVDGLAAAFTQDAAARAETYAAVAKAMADDAVVLPIVNPQLVFAYASDIEGVTFVPNTILNLASIRLKD
ncbi:ABC transporter substrate-binding protein [Microbacterium sp. NPDC091313]